MISDGLRLSDQLIQTWFGDRAVTLLVNVDSARRARRPSIDEHAKSYGASSHRRSHNEMKIASVKAVRDPPVELVQHDVVFFYRPITRKRPLIESEPRWSCIRATLVPICTTGRRKVLGALIAQIGFGRLQVVQIGASFNTTGID